jgi:hypothetical integral membrane protein (TIGR02206 family)
MTTDFVLFGPAHLVILAAIPSAAALLARLGSAPRVSRTLGVLLLVNEVIWHVYKLRVEGVGFPEGLPLQLCDLALWSTVLALLTLRPAIYDVAYFSGLAGGSMAVITPELWAPARSYPTCYFFLAHGGSIAAVLFLAWSGLLRPRPPWRALLVSNLFAAAVGAFNAVFRTNYMYLCHKPASASLLDYLGPWPLYVIAGEALALGLFTLLWLPFRRRGGPRSPSLL